MKCQQATMVICPETFCFKHRPTDLLFFIYHLHKKIALDTIRNHDTEHVHMKYVPKSRYAYIKIFETRQW
jgi:hypothetical protein